MSIGGALGGLFNSIVAPILFADLLEGIATLIVALLFVFQPLLKLSASGLLRGLALGGAAGAALAFISLKIEAQPLVLMSLIALSVAGLTLMFRRPFGTWILTVGLTVLLPIWIAGPDDRLFHDRSFFGLHQVLDQDGTRIYSNGTTTVSYTHLTLPTTSRV